MGVGYARSGGFGHMSTLKSRIPKIMATLDGKIEKAIKDGLEPIANRAQANAPEDTFFHVDDVSDTALFLIRAGQMTEQLSGPGLIEWMKNPQRGGVPITGGEDVRVNVGIYGSWYYYFKEYGTVDESPRPFLMPAWESGKGPMITKVRNALGDL